MTRGRQGWSWARRANTVPESDKVMKCSTSRPLRVRRTNATHTKCSNWTSQQRTKLKCSCPFGRRLPASESATQHSETEHKRLGLSQLIVALASLCLTLWMKPSECLWIPTLGLPPGGNTHLKATARLRQGRQSGWQRSKPPRFKRDVLPSKPVTLGTFGNGALAARTQGAPPEVTTVRQEFGNFH